MTKVQSLVNLPKSEPVLFWTALAVILNSAQITALVVAPWIHVVILLAGSVAAAIAARYHVTPVAG